VPSSPTRWQVAHAERNNSCPRGRSARSGQRAT
jgi:hypothetical protein